MIDLTEEGRRLLDDATPTFENELRTWLADALDEQALDQLASTIAVLRHAVEAAQVGMPTG